MHKMIRKTWFATMMFVVSIFAPVLALGWLRPFEAWLGFAMVMLVTPPIWWWLIGRRSRPGLGWGALAGTVSGLLYILPLILYAFAELRKPDPLGFGLFGVYLIAISLITVPIGAAVGTIIILLQRRWPELGAGAWEDE